MIIRKGTKAIKVNGIVGSGSFALELAVPKGASAAGIAAFAVGRRIELASILTGKSLLAFETEGRVTDVAVSRNGLAVLWTIAQAGRRKAFVTRLMTNYSGLMNTEPCPFPLGGEVAAFDAVYRGNVLQAVAFAAQGNGAWLVKCWHITGFKESANPATLGQFSATPRFIEIGDAHTVVVAAGVEAKALAVPQRSR